MDIEKLQTELKAKTEVNCFLACQWRDLNTSQNLAEMTGLGKEVGTDAAICQIATEFIKIKKADKINKQVIKILHKKCYPPGRSGRARSSGGLWGGGISVLERNEKLGFGMATIGR